VRKGLLVSMALLLLLPGAMLSQVRAIVAQGTSVLGQVDPFDGILRSIVAIFLIPATYLVVSYGIDVSNAIARAINDGYSQVFNGSMYEDAQCAMRRALPIRKKNKNGIPKEGSKSNPAPAGNEDNPRAQLEAIGIDIGASEEGGKSNGESKNEDKDSNKDSSKSTGKDSGKDSGKESGKDSGSSNDKNSDSAKEDDGKADEEVPVLITTQRLMINAANAGLGATWNVLCAFQMVYLYYLFCIGPVVAALWVCR